MMLRPFGDTGNESLGMLTFLFAEEVKTIFLDGGLNIDFALRVLFPMKVSFSEGMSEFSGRDSVPCCASFTVSK